MKIWIIAPYSNSYPDRIDEYWNHGYANGYISIGWDIPNPKGLSLSEIKIRLDEVGQLDVHSPHTVDKFMNQIKIGDMVIARKGVQEIIGIGTVVQDGFYDREMCRGLEVAKYDHHKMFIRVDWDTRFRARKVERRIFGMVTVTEFEVDSDLAKAEPWLVNALGLNVRNEQTAVEIIEIATRDNISITERVSLVTARIGQIEFRNKLLRRWNGKCGVTGLSNSQLLVASHIKPWAISSNRERLDANNGLLLHAGIDRAFDQGLISFSDEGKILMSGYITDEDCKILGIRRDSRLAIRDVAMISYLHHHREKVFLGGGANLQS
jgi:hypothetical protein